MTPRKKLVASAKLALFIVAVLVPARLWTVEAATFSEEWPLYAGFFVLVVAGLYLTLTFGAWVERKWGQS